MNPRNGRRARVAVGLAFASLLGAFLTTVEAASVFVQDPAGNRVIDPLFASDSGPGFVAVADLLAGNFAVAVDVPGHGALSTSAGIFDFVRWTNIFSGKVTAHVSADIDGDPVDTYDLVLDDPTGAVATQVTGSLGAGVGNSITRVARATHDLRIDAIGATSRLTDSSSGGTVTVAQADFDGLHMKLDIPGIDVNPGETLIVSFVITATDQVNAPVTGTGRALADFCCSAQLSLVLPPGVELSNDTGQTLRWVTNLPAAVPEPSSAILLGSAVLGLLAYRGRRKNRPHA